MSKVEDFKGQNLKPYPQLNNWESHCRRDNDYVKTTIHKQRFMGWAKKNPMVEEEEDLIGNVRAGKIDHSNEFRALSPMPEISPVSLTRKKNVHNCCPHDRTR